MSKTFLSLSLTAVCLGISAAHATATGNADAPAGGEIVTFDAPGVGYGTQTGAPYGLGTFPTGINNHGDIVGYYSDAMGGYHGFVRSAHGKFAIINDPSSTSSPAATIAQAMSDAGTVVGFWFDGDGNFHGFVRSREGAFTTVDPAGDIDAECYQQTTVAWAINDLNEFTGYWFDSNAAGHGFVALAVP